MKKKTPSKTIIDGKVHLVCPFGYCQHVWKQRVAHPVSCPKCKSRFDYPKRKK